MDNDEIYSVSTLNRTVSALLEQEFGWIWVEGELSNLACPASGHIYFSLKDDAAQVSCAMFRGRNRTLKFQPEDGLQVLVRAKVSLYQPRGNYQLIVDRMEESGDGALRRQFEELKARLEQEGLFDPAHKLAVPEIPESIAVVTSASGAAIHDVLSVIERRFPSIPVKLFNVPVQGVESAPAICNALRGIGDAWQAGELDCDVILLVRGGGSLEDLWSFNDERVARAVHACPLPVVSGVGHEVDVTIVDFVADLRAATPTAAAESVTPDQQSWLQTFDWYQNRLQQLLDDSLRRYGEQLRWLDHRLQQQHPQRQIELANSRSRDLLQRLIRSTNRSLDSYRHRLASSHVRLHALSPASRLQKEKQSLNFAIQRLKRAIRYKVEKDSNRLASAASTLNAISPLQTLGRGYSITTSGDGRALTDTADITKDEVIRTRLHRGQLTSRVIEIIPDTRPGDKD